jgi:hypothetical protein
MCSISSPLFEVSYRDSPPSGLLNPLTAPLTATIPIHELYAALSSVAVQFHFLYVF